MHSSLPLAKPDFEKAAKRLFADSITMPPEEWAARFSHTIGCSSFDQYRYTDPEFDRWVQYLHAILNSSSGDIATYRDKYLSREEIDTIEKQGVSGYGL
jgi:hypothetical protein